MANHIVLDGKVYCIAWQNTLYCFSKHTVLPSNGITMEP